MANWDHDDLKSKSGDAVNQPPHYARWPVQPIEFIAANDLPFWLANLIKYAMRYDAKGGLQDLYKARSYLDMQIRKLEGDPRFWEKPVSEQQSKLSAAMREVHQRIINQGSVKATP